MNNKEFSELQLRATIVPEQARWPAPDVKTSLMGETPTIQGLHWLKLHAAANEARQRVASAWAAMDEIDADIDLSPQGKGRKKQQFAADAIADFQKSKALLEAKDAVERQLAKWEKETGLAIKTPTNLAEIVMQSEIRAHLAAMKDKRLAFLERHATDPRVASAILGAPPFLSGLTDDDVAFVHNKIEQRVAPEIAEARTTTLKALEQAEQGWRRAQAKIGERAGLGRGCDHSNSEPA